MTAYAVRLVLDLHRALAQAGVAATAVGVWRAWHNGREFPIVRAAGGAFTLCEDVGDTVESTVRRAYAAARRHGDDG